MVYLVNRRSWRDEDWKREQWKEQTRHLRDATEKLWPELWRKAEGQQTDLETRVWEIALCMREYLRKFWSAPSPRERDWYIHRAREYWYKLYIQPELLKSDAGARPIRAEYLLDQPPPFSPIEKALYELQVRAAKPKLAPRVCPTSECERRYFLSTEKGQKYCPDCRRLQPARSRESKKRSYHQNKGYWPSTAKRRKHG